MGSTEQGRSISSGISIPQWMKNKSDKLTGFDPSAFSPPGLEDDFLFIPLQYQGRNNAPETTHMKTQTLSEVLQNKEQAFSKHTGPCKQFIPNIQDTVQVVKPKIVKPMGVDDGFKGEAARCAASVVEVAQRMVANSSFTTDDASAPPPAYFRQRRNSKSLPASPLTSPNSSPRARRKNNTLFALQNRFFTGPFTSDKSITEGDESGERKTSSNWMLSSLLSQHREIMASTEQLEQKDAAAAASTAAVKEDIAQNVKVTVEVKTAPVERERGTILKPKPSELREMNFWSPTSM